MNQFQTSTLLQWILESEARRYDFSQLLVYVHFRNEIAYA